MTAYQFRAYFRAEGVIGSADLATDNWKAIITPVQCCNIRAVFIAIPLALKIRLVNEKCDQDDDRNRDTKKKKQN